MRTEPDASGKRHQVQRDIGPVSEFPTKEAASRAAESLRENLAPARFRIGTVMRWPEALRLYEARDLAELSEGTQRNYRQLIRDYLEPVFESKHAHEITTQAVQDWIWAHASAARRAKVRPIKPLLGLLLTILSRLGQHGIAVVRPDRKSLRLPRDREPPRTLASRTFAAPQMDQLIAGAGCARDRALLGLLRYLGLRISEAAGLTTHAVRLDAELPALDIAQGAPRGRVQRTKTEKARRTLAIPPALADLLRAWIAELPATPEGFLFPGRAPGRAWHPDAIRRRMLRPLVTKLGLPRLAFHAFRHGAARELVGAGNLADARDALGHADARVTSKYAESTLEGQRRAILAAAERAAPAEVCISRDES